MKKLLVTGGAGFIGANFVHYWMNKYPNDKVVVIDALTYAGNFSNLVSVQDNENFNFVHGDICDQPLIESLLIKHDIDTLVHFAAESHVDRSITGPDAFIETNIIGTYSLLKAAKIVWLDSALANSEQPKNHRFHHVSTDEVYGTLSATDPAFNEETAYAPNSPYSASKAASDHLVRAYHHTYGLNVTTSNCSNNYGPYHFPEKLIPLVITNILHNKALPIDLVLNKGKIGENYNIGGNNEWANIDIVKTISLLVEKEFEKDKNLAVRFPDAISVIAQDTESLITYVQDRLGHDRRYAIDATKTNNELGYTPKESFKTGIDKTVQWYLNNENWWRSVMDGTYQDWINEQYSK